MRNGCLNSAFSGQIFALTQSQSRIIWTIESGSLPNGLEMSAVGKTLTISGTPAAVGLFNFTIQAAIEGGNSFKRKYAIIISEIANASLPDGNVGSAYSQTLTVNGPTAGDETWQVTSGSLPPGLSLNASTGAITGTPTTEGDYSFIICFTNGL